MAQLLCDQAKERARALGWQQNGRIGTGFSTAAKATGAAITAGRGRTVGPISRGQVRVDPLRQAIKNTTVLRGIRKSDVRGTIRQIGEVSARLISKGSSLQAGRGLVTVANSGSGRQPRHLSGKAPVREQPQIEFNSEPRNLRGATESGSSTMPPFATTVSGAPAFYPAFNLWISRLAESGAILRLGAQAPAVLEHLASLAFQGRFSEGDALVARLVGG